MTTHSHDHANGRQALSPDLGHLHIGVRKPVPGKLRRLRWAIGINAVVMLLEIIGGLLTNSLALLSDAGHMFTHVFALGVSYFAIVISERPATSEKTFGYFRAEVLAAFVNGLLLLGITGWIFYEATMRLLRPEAIKGIEMLVVAIIGLLANGFSFVMLLKVSSRDINLKSAFLHVVYDMVSSAAVVAGAGVIALTGMVRIDPIISAVIGVLILKWCIELIVESANILLEATPRDVDIVRIHGDVEDIPHVRAIHDIHVWQITTDMYVMTAHVALDDMPLGKTQNVIDQVNHVLREHHKIGHTTLQLEYADAPAERLTESAPREHGQ